MRQNTRKIAHAFLRRQAVESLQALVALATAEKPTKEQLQAARRARQNAALIKALGV